MTLFLSSGKVGASSHCNVALTRKDCSLDADVSVPVRRATPRNPRAVLGKATFEDMNRMLSVGKLGERQPPARVSKKSDDVENMVRLQVHCLPFFWSGVFVIRKFSLFKRTVSFTSSIRVFGSHCKRIEFLFIHQLSPRDCEIVFRCNFICDIAGGIRFKTFDRRREGSSQDHRS